MVNIKKLTISSVLATFGILLIYILIMVPILMIITTPFETFLKESLANTNNPFYVYIFYGLRIAAIVSVAVFFYLILRYYKEYFVPSLLIGLIASSLIFLFVFTSQVSNIEVNIIPDADEFNSSCFNEYMQDIIRIDKADHELFKVDGIPLENSTFCSAPECSDYFEPHDILLVDDQQEQCKGYCDGTTLKCR